jgi:ABC-2 type transport system ATP-binding protein
VGFPARDQRDGTTIILTTHYLEEAENLCRNIAIIDGGRIIERDR